MKRIVLTLVFALSLACSSSATVDRDALGDADAAVNLTGDAIDSDLSINGDGKGLGDATAPKPGEFGAPCTANEDCLSGYCIEGLDGYICTKICMEDCPTGYDCVGVNIGPDVVFICVPMLDRSCEPCTSDLQCSGGRCVPFGGSKYCLSPCEAAGCKESYDCQNVQIGDAVQELCMPASGTCECVPASIGLEKACKQKTGVKVCYGVQFCEDNGWGDCSLPVEFCDGKDNDCNGTGWIGESGSAGRVCRMKLPFRRFLASAAGFGRGCAFPPESRRGAGASYLWTSGGGPAAMPYTVLSLVTPAFAPAKSFTSALFTAENVILQEGGTRQLPFSSLSLRWRLRRYWTRL